MALNVEQLTGIVQNQNLALVDSRFSSLPEPTYRGKVRDTYDLGDDKLLIVATDRISTYDCIHPNGIPGKGIILTQMTLNWLERLKDCGIYNHLISADPKDFPEPFKSQPKLAHRSMMVECLEMLPVECIVRGYIAGSAWSEYQKTGTVFGHKFNKPLQESEAFDSPIFTPSTKAETGHDENISYKQMTDLLIQYYNKEMGTRLAEKLRTTSLLAYHSAYEYAKSHGILVADTKFEFGLNSKLDLILADEVLTPDSSRFWAEEYHQPGKSQSSFDKQYVRDWATGTGWDKKPPAPVIPLKVVQQTQAKYLKAYKRLFP